MKSSSVAARLKQIKQGDDGELQEGGLSSLELRLGVSSDNGQREVSQLVGWPPVRAFRKKLSTPSRPADAAVVDGLSKAKPSSEEDGGHGAGAARDGRSAMFVKVNLEGYAVGRKIDLTAHGGYGSLSRALQTMFHGSFLSAARDGDEDEQLGRKGGDGEGWPRRYILLYEDSEGDRMLVGDVPWGLFIASVKRLYIAQDPERVAMARGEASYLRLGL